MANIKQVAERAGLSVACVSKYLKDPGSVRQASKEKIQEAIKELNYVPSSIARSLRTKRTGVVKVIMHSITNSFFAELFELLRKRLEETGRVAVLQVIDAMEPVAFHPSDFMLSDGVIVCFPDNDTIFTSLQKAAPDGYPAVCIHGHAVQGIASVVADVKHGMRLAADYLISLGCKSFAYIGGPVQSAVSILKFGGFSEALAAQQGTFCTEVLRGTYDLKAGYEEAKELLERNGLPDAIVCENDNLAAGVVHCLMEENIAIPGKVRVTGYDNIPLAEMIYPGLTSVELRLEEVSEAACATLQSLFDKQKTEDLFFAPRLVIRQS